MPLLFFIDKDILDDPSCNGVEDVVLSYTFFRYELWSDVIVLLLIPLQCKTEPTRPPGA